MIALISSVPLESEILRSSLNNLNKLPCGPKTIYSGTIHSQPVVVMNCGIGKVNAAWAATVLCEKFSLTLLINHGICGAYPETELHVGDIAVAQKEIYGDEGVIERDGWHDLKRIGISVLEKQGKKLFNEFECAPHISQYAVEQLKKTGMKTHYGAFVTVSTASGLLTAGLEYQKRYNALCENMEGAAVAHISALYNVPFMEIRAVSNIVEDRDLKKWNISLAAQNCQRAILELVRAINLM